MSTTEIYRDWRALDSLAPAWSEILASCSKGIDGPDATCSVPWARAIAATHLRTAAVRLFVVSSAGVPVAIFPTYLSTTAGFPLARRELRAMTEVYGGRCGFLIRDGNGSVLATLQDQLVADAHEWDAFVFTVVADSASHRSLKSMAARHRLPCRIVSTTQSPYIDIAAGWDALLAGLPKKMRWTIRKSEKDLSDLGRLQYDHVVAPQGTAALLAAIYEVEQGSWKAESGTSITAQAHQRVFYEALVETAAEVGMLNAHVLRLDGRPIAYILGLSADDGTFLDLKESFVLSHAEHSPGHVLKRFAIPTLVASGVHTYDFMGNCEPYKMRWTDKTYRCATLCIYSPTLRGRLAWWRTRLARVMKRT